MSVLAIRSEGPMARGLYDEWLADYDGDVVLLCTERTLPLPPDSTYAHVEVISDDAPSGTLESRALELARAHRVEHVVAVQEWDVVRAAQLREVLALPGQQFADALPFRDKVRMKELAAGAGVPVATYAELDCATDLLEFAERQGYPVVVKPRDGMGSFGVRILRSPSDVHRFLDTEWTWAPGTQSNLIVEGFVSEYMCHVDGVVVDGRVVYSSPSRYLYALAVFEGDRSGRYDVVLDADDPLSRRLQELTDKVLGALPCPKDFSFHEEVFLTPDGELVLCEIACRSGGAAQRDIQLSMWGLDPSEAYVRAQVGLPLPYAPGPERLRPPHVTGQLVLLKRPGRVLRVPGEAPFPWVVSRRDLIAPGDVMAEPAFAADFMTLCVVTAPTKEESLRRLAQLEEWFLTELELEDVDA